MNEKKFLVDYFDECKKFLNQPDIADKIIEAKKVILATKESGGQLIFAGNGASASIANHASLDFTKQGKVRSVNFNESAFITAFSNDYGYENWIEKALGFYAAAGDTLILVSCSGTSPNVVNAARYANDNDINVITFTGFDSENPLKLQGDISFWLDCRAYNIIEGVHQLWLLAICDLIIGKSEYSVS
jgi:D-sedoheptulose 7-phosphate isomerase